MSTFTVFAPKWIAEGGISSPRTVQGYPAQTAAWRDGDILTPVTTGTITLPTQGAGNFTNATGALTPGPSLGTNPVPFQINNSSSSQTQGVVTVTGTTAASAPAQTYFVEVTYVETSLTNESQVSVPFIINCAAGVTPNVNVASAGAPAGADHYAVYASFMPNTFWLQHAVVALGTATAIVYPLTNSIGLNKGSVGISSSIFGMADSDSDAYFAGQLGAAPGGSQATGKRSLFGATQSYGPGWTNDPYALPVTKLQIGLMEINLVQAYSPGLNYASVGFNIDSATGYFTADTTQTAAAVIQDLAYYPDTGNTGDFGARVRIKLNGSALI